MNDLAVGSSDAVVLCGELSELLGRPVSPVDFWQQPTINALARFLSGSEPESAAEPVASRYGGSLDEPIASVPVRREPRYGIALATKPLPNGPTFATAGDWHATRLPCLAKRP